MKKQVLSFFALSIVLVSILCFPTSIFAEVEWHVLSHIPLGDNPLDIAMSRDGTMAFILCGKNILLYSIEENKITDTIPVTGKFSQIALSPDGETLLLTDIRNKQISIIQVSQVYDIEIGQSPIIGKADAPVSVFAFLDYQ